MRTAPPTETEQKLLALVLREVRHVAKTKEQLSIVVDPWVAGDGTHLSFHYNGQGWTTELAGTIRGARKTSRRKT